MFTPGRDYSEGFHPFAHPLPTAAETASFQLMGNTTYPNFKAISALFKEKQADSLPGL